jgi:hypothetical protein
MQDLEGEYQDAFLAALTMMLPNINTSFLGTGRVKLYRILQTLHCTEDQTQYPHMLRCYGCNIGKKSYLRDIFAKLAPKFGTPGAALRLGLGW